MAVRIVITPGDSMWWVMRPEFLAYVDEVVLDRSDYERVEAERSDSAYRAVVWKRLSVLGDNGLLAIASVDIDWQRENLKAERKIREILCDDAKAAAFVADMVFAYRYWIEFNQQRLEVMPVDDDYAASVTTHLPVWLADLDLLVSRGKRALIERPEIAEQTARSILGRVGCLREIVARYEGIAFASLKQFQPFIKYVDSAPDAELPLGQPQPTIRGYLPEGMAGGWRDLPIEPDIAFLSFELTKREIWERLAAVRRRHEDARAWLSSILEGPGQATPEGAPHLDALSTATRLDSAYLSDIFYGLTLMPGARQAAPPPAGAAGVRSCYGILETLLDTSKFARLPRAKPRRRRKGLRAPAFWRAPNPP